MTSDSLFNPILDYPQAEETEKTCIDCKGNPQPLENFYSRNMTKNGRVYFNRSNFCKKCYMKRMKVKFV